MFISFVHKIRLYCTHVHKNAIVTKWSSCVFVPGTSRFVMISTSPGNGEVQPCIIRSLAPPPVKISTHTATEMRKVIAAKRPRLWITGIFEVQKRRKECRIAIEVSSKRSKLGDESVGDWEMKWTKMKREKRRCVKKTWVIVDVVDKNGNAS